MTDSAEIRDFLARTRNILAAMLTATSRLREEGAAGYSLEAVIQTPAGGLLTLTFDSSLDDDDEVEHDS